ncbi:class I SAM-dependent DNA methyltransferase [Nannocystis radixulma]|uniref:site-specific DNA-methyltransferase (adenine-specific) n=1 Tax=Nannocystis radixulma TaxID=2995305 RepID=A0ABT5BBL0_9BACT|nr:DNA methyltransferase [Nannocystis radixulma]MDC0670432.1 N-6 DNA methylase [Nannocystis radixulma]
MSVETTRAVAAGLSSLAARLRRRTGAAEEAARFLIRCTFTLIAETLELAPHGGMAAVVSRSLAAPDRFAPGLTELWSTLTWTGEAAVLTATPAQALGRVELAELHALTQARWEEVDPVIFGDLLLEALDPGERRQLGAHFTPRAYVERLVGLVVEEPLRADWVRARGEAQAHRERGEAVAASRVVRGFLAELASVRVLDPACGAGNFLIVAHEALRRLADEAAQWLLAATGEVVAPAVSLAQSIGVDRSAWTCEVARLVLWIAAIRGRPAAASAERATIVHGDALLTPWPPAMFVVGNPPFLGKSRLRASLGESYVARLRAYYDSAVPESADLVMYWWHRAATLLQAGQLRRFGLVTTNSVTQIYNRRVVEAFLAHVERPIHLVWAVADHPWVDGPRGAAVRIAMTVAEAGRGVGRSIRVLPGGGEAVEHGPIFADLRVGVDLGRARRLQANAGLAGAGVMLGGRGFLVRPGELDEQDAGHVRPIVNGSDVLQRPRGTAVIDFTGLSEAAARGAAPAAFERLVEAVRPERLANVRAGRRERWWQFAETMPATRRAIAGLPRYIVTPETAKHRVFVFVDGAVVPEHPLLAIGLADAFHLAVLSSRIHGLWARANGGTLADRPRYNKSVCFETFPFPDCEAPARADIAALGEQLDACRRALAAAGWTVTAMYNAPPPALQAVHAAIDVAVGAAYALAGDGPESAVLTALLALNHRRAAEEQAGAVRRLRAI